MVKRRQVERIYTDDEYNYLRCDIKQDKGNVRGVLYLNNVLEFADVYALRFGHSTELVKCSINEYSYPNMSFDSRLEDIRYMCEFTVQNTLGGLKVDLVLFSVLALDKGTYSTKPLGLFVDKSTLDTMEHYTKSILKEVLTKAQSLDNVYKVINEED